MRVIKAMSIAAAVVFPLAGARGDGGTHEQGPMPYGAGLGIENELFINPDSSNHTLTAPPQAGTSLNGVIKDVVRMTPFRLNILQNCTRLDGKLLAFECRVES